MSITLSRRRTLAQHNIPLVCGHVQRTPQPENWRNTISCWSAGMCTARHNPNTGATQYPVGLHTCAVHDATRKLAQHNIPLVCRRVPRTPQPEHWRNTISRWSAGVWSARCNPNTGATQYPVGLRACAVQNATRTLAQHNIPLVCGCVPRNSISPCSKHSPVLTVTVQLLFARKIVIARLRETVRVPRHSDAPF